MFKDVLNHMSGASDFASIGLIIFFLVFLGITLVALLRPKSQIARWSRLPLSDDAAPETDHASKEVRS